MGINILGIVWENTVLGPGTKLPHILCAGIGPVQLGVVLVIKLMFTAKIKTGVQLVLSVYTKYV